ncbi:Bifunctional inhibitor/plant lipid transfer protein/seed storage helical domain [Macleaya cordata]|uniref:Bifunctional inhibitor/plant lipid transfer protein/seed storage helical domain n=1 Tax=Macleaya cordata TaxID=56857 RepID=A0A200QKG1_MACCD|nr:Bifunctional inhibitor/plant lipid transfer protein/seed storage helical domain [Macleaya cordata]
MARFTIIAALLVALLAVAEASIYRTTITTTEIENDSTQSEKCRREMQGMQMNECERYLEQSRRGLIMINPTRQVPEECCREMREVSEECRCEAVKQMMHHMQQGGEYKGQEMREMMQTAKQLPSMCGMRPQHCEIPGGGYWY